ncbi:MAG: hypothetical protein JF612_08795 [Planctomycetia bacterium]|nr:hypothetical protein [Planctomycetia bacterium]
MTTPPQGFRHAVDLLLTNAVRKLPSNLPPERTITELIAIAEHLVALAADMHAEAAYADWVIAEYERVLTPRVDPASLAAAKDRSRTILRTIGTSKPQGDRRDLFILYAPEDRLPIAAPLAVELSKRRVRVAFSEFEAADETDISQLIDSGTRAHDAGVLLVTSNFVRRFGVNQMRVNSNILVVTNAEEQQVLSLAEKVKRWLTTLKH